MEILYLFERPGLKWRHFIDITFLFFCVIIFKRTGGLSMEEEVQSLFNLLEEKNSYLLEFHKINNNEIERLIKGHQDNLENFYYSRELLLNAIDKLDKQIAKEEKNACFEAQQEEKRKLKEILLLKRNMVLSILDQDLTIISLVDKLKKTDGKKSAA